MRLNDVTFGVPGCGPAIGQKTITITIGEGAPFDFASEDPYDFPLYKEFKEKIDASSTLQDAYRESIDGSMKCFITFIGGEIEKQENDAEFEAFFTLISRDAISYQKAKIGTGENGLKNPGQLNPPFLVFYGTPRVFTGSRDWYQHFRAVLAKITDRDYSQVALKEMVNHQFSAVLQYVDSKPEDLLDTFITPKKISIVDTVPQNTTLAWTMNQGYRYYAEPPGLSFQY